MYINRTLNGYNKSFCYDQAGRLICEKKTGQYYGEGSAIEKFVYLYDESNIVGMVHTTEAGATSTYYFRRNLLGDVVAIHPAHNSHPIHWQLNNINPVTGRIGQKIRWDLLLRRVIGK